jgi:hypothetical protein
MALGCVSFKRLEASLPTSWDTPSPNTTRVGTRHEKFVIVEEPPYREDITCSTIYRLDEGFKKASFSQVSC